MPSIPLNPLPLSLLFYNEGPQVGGPDPKHWVVSRDEDSKVIWKKDLAAAGLLPPQAPPPPLSAPHLFFCG